MSLSPSSGATETPPRDAMLLLPAATNASDLLAARVSFPPFRTFYLPAFRRYEVPDSIELPVRLDLQQQLQPHPDLVDELEAIQLGPTEIARNNAGPLRECIHLQICTHLPELSICNQRLRQLEHLPPTLRVLILAGNDLRRVPECIHSLIVLQHLDLSHNQCFGEVVGTTALPLSLEHFNFTHNPQCHTLDLRMPGARLRFVDIRGNHRAKLLFWQRKPAECYHESEVHIEVERVPGSGDDDGDAARSAPNWARNERHWLRKTTASTEDWVHAIERYRREMDTWFALVIEGNEYRARWPERYRQLVEQLRDGRCGYTACYPVAAKTSDEEWTRVLLFTRFLRLCYQRELYFDWRRLFDGQYRGSRARLMDMARWKYVYSPDEPLELPNLEAVFPKTAAEPHFAEALEQPEVMNELFGLWRHVYVHEDAAHGRPEWSADERAQWMGWESAQHRLPPGPERSAIVDSMVRWQMESWWPRFDARTDDRRLHTFPMAFAPTTNRAATRDACRETKDGPSAVRRSASAPREPARPARERAKKRDARERAKKRDARKRATKRNARRLAKRNARKPTTRATTDRPAKTRHHRAVRGRR